MALTVAAFMSLAVSCAPQVAPETLAAIARAESSFNEFAIHDNTTRQSHAPTSKEEAVAITTRLLAAGHSIDAGILQINVGNWGWTDLTLETAFDPCANIRAGATVLTQISRYNTGSSTAGFRNGYVTRVVSAASKIRNRDEAPGNSASNTPPPAHDWDVFHDETEDQQSTPQPIAAADANPAETSDVFTVKPGEPEAAPEPSSSPPLSEPADGRNVAVNFQPATEERSAP